MQRRRAGDRPSRTGRRGDGSPRATLCYAPMHLIARAGVRSRLDWPRNRASPTGARAAPPRTTGSGTPRRGILVAAGAGLAFRLIIAYAPRAPASGSTSTSFQFWAEQSRRPTGLSASTSAAVLPDYTPGYLYVLWLVGDRRQRSFGVGIGDLIKLPPILADVASAGWSGRCAGARRRAGDRRWIGAALVVFNPVTWFDSVVWGQVDSFGVVFLLLALRELWRDRPERAGDPRRLAAIIKPQLGHPHPDRRGRGHPARVLADRRLRRRDGRAGAVRGSHDVPGSDASVARSGSSRPAPPAS